MPKRKTTVSLARGTAPDKVGRGFEDLPPEQLRRARAAGAARVDASGVRRLADPFDLLRARNLLDRADITANETLWHAGDRFRSHWHGAQFGGLSAFDFSRPMVDGGGTRVPGALNPSEIAQRHREHYTQAAAAIGSRLLPYVTRIVIDGETAARLGALVAETAHARTAEALALERLREGLHRLCDHWSMRSTSRPLPLKVWREAAGRE